MPVTETTEYIIEINTTSKAIIDQCSKIEEVKVSTTRNLTGGVIIVLSVATPLATVLIKEVAKVIGDRQATIRAQKLKIGEGTISFEGFSADEIGRIVTKLSATDVVRHD